MVLYRDPKTPHVVNMMGGNSLDEIFHDGRLEGFNGEIQRFIDSATGVYKSAGDRWF